MEQSNLNVIVEEQKGEIIINYYKNTWRKISDFLIGFLGNLIILFIVFNFFLSYPMSIIKSIISLVVIIIIFASPSRLFEKGRKFIAIGIISSIILFPMILLYRLATAPNEGW